MCATEVQHSVPCIQHKSTSDSSTMANLAVDVGIMRVNLFRHEVLHMNRYPLCTSLQVFLTCSIFSMTNANLLIFVQQRSGKTGT